MKYVDDCRRLLVDLVPADSLIIDYDPVYVSPNSVAGSSATSKINAIFAVERLLFSNDKLYSNKHSYGPWSCERYSLFDDSMVDVVDLTWWIEYTSADMFPADGWVELTSSEE